MKTPVTMLAIAAGVLGAAAPSTAEVVYSNNFNSENNGVSAQKYTGFNGLTVRYPSVDLIHTNDGSGIKCAGKSGGCVDLDGGTAGQLISDQYSFNTGDVLRWTFSVSGSQRASSPVDFAYYAFRFDQPTGGHFDFASSSGYTTSDDFGALQNDFDPSTYDVAFIGGAAYDDPFFDVTFTFTPTNSGTFRFLFDGYFGPSIPDEFGPADTDDDGAGRIIDDVTLSISAVPEPSAWAMMIVGFAAIAGSMRRRRAAVTTIARRCHRVQAT